MSNYASSKIRPFKSVQMNLRIEAFAVKHGFSIEQVEHALTLPVEEAKVYLRGLKC